MNLMKTDKSDVVKMPQPNCQYTTRYCWEAEKVKTLIRLRAELSPLFTGKRNASKYAWAVVERELSVPLPLSKIIKKWNNLLQEYKAIKLSDEPKRREWPFFNLMDVYFSDQVNDPTLRLFSSTKTLGSDTFEDHIKLENDPIMSSAIAAATAGSLMDISDMMHEEKTADNYFEDGHQEVAGNTTNSSSINANNNNNNNNNNSNNNNNNNIINNNNNSNHSNHNMQNNNNHYKFMDRHRASAAVDYEDKMDSDKELQQPHTPNYMNQHHNIDQYLLSWNNFHGNMCKGFHNLQKDEKMVDVTIAAGGKIFKAHKLVLSVCSSYFQKIFLDHPSSHPILFMTDVNSSHMAGLLDFMYSGQVNVKYEDLPKFLKVAEAMQIKGLHKESTTDAEEAKFPKHSPPTLIKEASMKPLLVTSNNGNNGNNNNSPNHINNNNNIPTIPPLVREPNFREHIRAKTSSHLDIFNSNNNNNNNNNNNTTANNNNISTTNNNNNTSINNNNNTSINNNNNNNMPSKYVIQQTNSSSKILDNQKYHKYFSKRKMMAQYEHEMLNDKRNKPNAIGTTEDLSLKNRCNSPIPLVVGSGGGSTGSSGDGNNNSNGGGGGGGDCNENNCSNGADLSISQRIKVEPDIILSQDEDNSTNEYYMADLSKRKLSQLEHVASSLSHRHTAESDSRNMSAVCS